MFLALFASLLCLTRAATLPGRFILEFTHDAHDDFHALARRQAIDYKVRHVYRDDNLLHGVSIHLANGQDASSLNALPGVKRIIPVTTHRRNEAGEVKVVAVDPVTASKDAFNPHVMTRVSELHAKGILGKGAAICVIDDGVDYTHPALGGCFGKGCKVDRGYDFVGDERDPTPDNDPMPCPTGIDTGHGTHCTGIIGAQDKLIGFTGAAPLANLGMYRIFDCTGSYALDDAIAAILRATQDGCDVLSMSFGDPGGWSAELLSQTASRAVLKAGKIVAISMGNSAREGLWYAQSPQAGRGTIGVGSIDVEKVQGWQASLSTGRKLNYIAPINFRAGVALSIYTLAKSYDDPKAQICSFPFATTFVENVVVVINGACAPIIQRKLAKRQLNYIFLWTQSKDLPPQNILAADMAGVISEADGRYLYEQAARGTVTITFSATSLQIPNLVNGGSMSPFSTYGPTWSMDSPSTSVSAPGGEILSLWPVKFGSYAIQSGTSMSTPLVAGIAGLYISSLKRGQKVDPLVFRDILESSARPINVAGSKDLDTVVHQGSGEVDAFCAVLSPITASPGQIMLGDSRHGKSRHRITIRNSGRHTMTYEVRHRSALTALTHTNDTTTYAVPPPLIRAPATIRSLPKRLRVPAGRTVSFEIDVRPPRLPAAQFGVYSGFVELRSGRDCPLSIAYTGVASDLSKLNQIGNPGLLDAQGRLQNGTAVYTFKNGDYPTLQFVQAAGTAILAVDLVSANTPRSLMRRSHGDSMDDDLPFLIDTVTSNASLVARDRTSGDVVDPSLAAARAYLSRAFPRVKPLLGVSLQTYLPRNPSSSPTSTVYFPFTTPSGSYRVLLRALKLYGDPRRADSYSTYLSEVFEVRRSL